MTLRTGISASRPPGRGRASTGGFTLVELAVVVFVLASVLAIAAPSFVRSWREAQLNSVARSVTTLSQLARLQAALHQRPTEIHVDLDLQEVWLTQRVTTEEAAGEIEVTRKRVTVPPLIRLTAVQKTGEPAQQDGAVTMVFYVNGTCDGGTLWLQGSEKRDAVTLVFDPVTARVTPYSTKR